jgi:hypothetical protein
MAFSESHTGIMGQNMSIQNRAELASRQEAEGPLSSFPDLGTVNTGELHCSTSQMRAAKRWPFTIDDYTLQDVQAVMTLIHGPQVLVGCAEYERSDAGRSAYTEVRAPDRSALSQPDTRRIGCTGPLRSVRRPR